MSAFGIPRRSALAALVTALVLLVPACDDEPARDAVQGTPEPTPSRQESAPPADDQESPSPAGDGSESPEPEGDGGDRPAPKSVTGLILSIEEKGGQIRSFVVHDERTDRKYEISIDPQLDYGFDLHHLVEHQEGALPVKVVLDQRGRELFATEILDA